MPKHNKTGRTKDKGRFCAVPHQLMDSRAFTSLSPLAQACWLSAMGLYNGSNNGMIALATRRLGDMLGGVSHTTVSRALRELVNHGFLRAMKSSSFSYKRTATEYRFTHLPCNKTGNYATHEYKNYGIAACDRTA